MELVTVTIMMLMMPTLITEIYQVLTMCQDLGALHET